MKSELPKGGKSPAQLRPTRAHLLPIAFLSVTSLEYDQLEALSIKEIKAYLSAYDIQIPSVSLSARRVRASADRLPPSTRSLIQTRLKREDRVRQARLQLEDAQRMSR